MDEHPPMPSSAPNPTVPTAQDPRPVVVPDEMDRAIEALVMVAEEPVEPRLLAQLLEIPVVQVEARCRSLAAQYEADGRGFQLARVAGGYRYQTHPDLAPYVERYVLDGQGGKLSAAALETLAIVAYRQPISRAQVAAIRGVNVDGVMRTLTQRGLVVETGKDPGPGQASLYGTTRLFLERLALDRIEDLPPLADFVPDGSVVETLERTLLADGDPRRRHRSTPSTSAPSSDELPPSNRWARVPLPGDAASPGAAPILDLDDPGAFG